LERDKSLQISVSTNERILRLKKGDLKMPKVMKSAIINAPVEKVFNYATDQTNMPEIWPSMVDVKILEKLPNGGTKSQYTYKMAGMRFEGINFDTEFVQNKRTVTRTEGGIESEITWDYEAEGETTRLTIASEYTIPIPLIGKMAEKFILKQNENELEIILANLKARMEE
jgi:uncharacterized membrane protein